MYKTIEQLLQEVEQMEFCIDDGTTVSDSDGLYAVLHYLTKLKNYDQQITIGLWKDHRDANL